ncbi:MAG: SDR family oxidoreductase [Pseudomonadota bacterium]
MKTLVIGANGLTGKRLVRQLMDSDHMPVAMIRDTGQRAYFDSIGVPTVLADLEYPIDHAVRGCEAVVFAAGSGSATGKDKTVLVDQLGAIRSMVAAEVNGVTRYVMLSTTNADINSQSRIAHYHRAKGHADNHLMGSSLSWTVVCPGRLLEDAGTGLISIDTEPFAQGTTSRDNLASVLARSLDLDQTIGARFNLFEGDTDIDSALGAIGAGE